MARRRTAGLYFMDLPSPPPRLPTAEAATSPRWRRSRSTRPSCCTAGPARCGRSSSTSTAPRLGHRWNATTDGLPAGDAPAWRLDGDAATFNDAERDAIQSIWQRVAEDYAPFDVDVTTAGPRLGRHRRTSAGRPDLRHPRADHHRAPTRRRAICCGDRAAASPTSASSTHRRQHHATTSRPWSSRTARRNDTKNIAEAATHEVGPQLRAQPRRHVQPPELLRRATDVGADHGRRLLPAGDAVEQGRVRRRNNTQDDLAIIAANGAPLVADEAGGTIGTASRRWRRTEPASPPRPTWTSSARHLRRRGHASLPRRRPRRARTSTSSSTCSTRAGAVVATANPASAHSQPRRGDRPVAPRLDHARRRAPTTPRSTVSATAPAPPATPTTRASAPTPSRWALQRPRAPRLPGPTNVVVTLSDRPRSGGRQAVTWHRRPTSAAAPSPYAVTQDGKAYAP